jgi:hypothetical protein
MRGHLGERWPLFHPQETFGSCCADGFWVVSKNLLPITEVILLIESEDLIPFSR